MNPDLMREISTWVLPVLVAITFHEAAHGFVAWKCGDDTAYMLGRVTFNPLKHIDPFGTIILPALLFFGGGFLFGYAKPVPVNFRRLGHFRRDMILVAAAGPGINLLLAITSAALIHLTAFLPPVAQEWSFLTLKNSINLNVVLALFNMFPLLPLDGGRVLVGLLPPSLARPFAKTERYGMLVLLALIFLPSLIWRQTGVDINILGWILGPAQDYVVHIIAVITGLGG